MEQSEEDLIYYNITEQVNLDDEGGVLPFKELNFSTTRADTILDRPNEYEVAVARFSVPGLFIPLLILTNPLDPYFIELAFGSAVYRETVVYLDQTNNPNPRYNRAIWSVEQLLQGINEAIQLAFDRFKLDYPSSPINTAPQFFYEADTQLISIIADPFYQDQSQTGISTVELRVNRYLYNIIPSFYAFQYVPGTPQNPIPSIQSIYKIFILKKGNGKNLITLQGDTYLEIKQEFPTINLWNEFKSIVFQSDTIPVNNELLPTTNNQTRPILTDFTLPSTLNDRSDIQFQAEGLQLRWNTMTSQIPLKTIDIKAFWVDSDGELFPVIVPRFQVFSLKLVFKRRAIYQKQVPRIDTDHINTSNYDLDAIKKRLLNDLIDIEKSRSYTKQNINDPLFKVDYDKQKEEVDKEFINTPQLPQLQDNSIKLPAMSVSQEEGSGEGDI